MNTTFSDLLSEENVLKNPYNNSFDATYIDDSPGLNFNHKLRDFEEFTASAQHFEEFGRYTNYPPNRHPNSRFMQFWKEEKRRSLVGYNIGRDWIPGYMYWYLNYQRVEKTFYKEKDIPTLLMGGKVRAERKEAFPDPWDYDYYYFHYLEEAEKQGKHASVLKSRGKGYSYKGAAMVNRNYFLIPKSKSYIIADEKSYLDGTDGIMSRAFDSKEFVNANTAFFKYSHKRNVAINYRASKVVTDKNGKSKELGHKSEVIGISLKGNVDRARGKRGKLILWEESGSFPLLLRAWQIARESVEQDGAVFGLMVAFGTSGSDSKSFANLREMFTKPDPYGILGITNIWSMKNSKKKVSFFVPSYTNLNGLTDKNGNCDVRLGYAIEEKRLEEMRLAKAETDTILQHKMERPKHPEEALLRRGGNHFNVSMLRDVLAGLEESEEEDARYVGHMGVNANGEVVFLESDSDIPVDNFPHDNTADNSGAIVIQNKPIKGRNGRVISNVYIAGGDPYDQDKSTTESLGSIYIMNAVTGVIVASYTGRPRAAIDYWEQARLLLLYYDARINHENDLIGFSNHLKAKGCEYLMVDTPEVVYKVSPNSKVDRGKGTHATTNINRFARSLIDIYTRERMEDDSELTYAYTIKDKALLQELIDWDPDGNFDRVSALGMLMILYEEYKGFGKTEYEEEKDNSLGSEDIWEELLGE